MNSEVQMLKNVISFQHDLTKWYASLLKDTDVDKTFECEGKRINSLFWIIAHLAYAENTLLLKALGKKGHEVEWLKQYDLGSGQDIPRLVSYEELVKVAKEIHLDSMKALDEMSDSELNKDNELGIAFSGNNSKRTVIMHHIRHEGMHTGHLSLLCKLNGIKTV